MTSEKQRNEIMREMESRFGSGFQVYAERDEVHVSFPIEDPRSGYRYASAVTRRNLDGRKSIKEEDFDAIEEDIREGFRKGANDVRFTEQAKDDYRQAYEALATGWTYCECGDRLETPSEYEDGKCERCYFEQMDRGPK